MIYHVSIIIIVRLGGLEEVTICLVMVFDGLKKNMKPGTWK